MDITYFDLNDNTKVLTEEEIQWFYGICEQCKNATGIVVPIKTKNHEKMKGKSKEAMGIFWTSDYENPLNKDAYITIDNAFIHECYEEAFCGKYNLFFDTLEHVIAHEFAHGFQWRHCKKHSALTKELYEKITRYQRDFGALH